jgi:hypothetical protein
MRKTLVLASVLTCAISINAQDQATKNSGTPAPAGATAPAIVITPTSTPAELARAALQAQGGEKFRNVQNMILRGSAQLYAPNSIQSIPGSFSIVTSGDKLRMDIDARPAFVFKQIYDGQNSFSSMPGVEVPPLPRYGMAVLLRFDQPGYKVSALPDKKKQRAFRIVDPDGYTTDFFIDSTNGRIMSFLGYYQGFTFGIENSKFKEVDGILVPTSFSQRFEMPQGAFFAEFNVKDVKLNQTLAEDAFVISH